MKYDLTPIYKGYHKKDKKRAGKVVGKREHVYTRWEYKLGQPYGKHYEGSSKKLNTELPYDPFWVFIKDRQNTNLKRYMTPIFIAAFFTTAKPWKYTVSINWMNG